LLAAIVVSLGAAVVGTGALTFPVVLGSALVGAGVVLGLGARPSR
jgi:hypothetical protein